MGAAERTEDFINSIGVNTHISYTNSSYVSTSEVLASLMYLGINHVRDANLGTAINTNPWLENQYFTMAAAGIKFDLVLPPTQSLAADLTFLNTMESAYPGSILAVEGPNEISSTTKFVTGGTGLAALPAYEEAVYSAITGDPALAGVAIYSNSFLMPVLASSVGVNLSPYVTDGNAHIYFNENQPQANLQALFQSTVDVPGDPRVVTETGYATDPGVDPASGTMNVNDDVQAKFTLDLLFDDLSAGAQQVYLYELLDEFIDPNNTTREAHFGLFNYNGTPKPAAVALHNLTTILADNSPAASTFTTGDLNYTVTGQPQYNLMFVQGYEYQNFGGSTYLMEKSNGAFDLSVWAEPQLWNDVTIGEFVAPPSLVTVSLAQTYQTIELFDPMFSSSPFEILHNISQVQIILTDHPIIIEVEPNGVGSNAQAIGEPNVFGVITEAKPNGVGNNVQAIAEPNVFGVTGIAANQPTGDNASLQPFSTVNITDSETSPGIAATIYLYNSSGQLTDANGTLSGPANVMASSAAGLGLTKIGVGEYVITALSAAALTAALQSLIFTPTEYNVAVGQSVTTAFSIVLSDGTGTAIESGSSVIAVAQETPPAITGIKTDQAISDTQTLQPFASTVISEPDYGASISVTIIITGAGGATDADGTLSGAGLTKTGTGTYTLSAGTPAAVTAALEQLVFTPASGQVAAGQNVTTNFDLIVTDGTDTTSAAASAVVTATGPTLSGTVAATGIDNASQSPFGNVTVNDADSSGAESATITLLNANGKPSDANGVLSGAGLIEIAYGIYSLSAGSPAAMAAAIEALTFTPTDHQVAPGQSVVTQVDISVSDGSRFGTTVGTITTVALDTAPAITGTTSGQAITDQQTLRPFANAVIADPDFGAADSVTITLTNAGSATDADGTLSGAGLIKTGLGTYILAAATPAELTAELQQLVFTPTAGQVDTGQKVSTTFYLTVSDGTDIATNTTTSVTVTATGPILSGFWNLGAPDNGKPTAMLKVLNVTDPESNGPETATITVLDASGNPTDANGFLSGAGLTKTGIGTYTISAASPSAMTAALQALTFAFQDHEVAPGQSVTTQFAVSVSDGVRTGAAIVSKVTVVAVDTAPGITGTVAAQTIADIQTIQPFAKTVITDPDVGAADSVTITLVNASGSATDAQGSLSGTGLAKTGIGTYTLAVSAPGVLTAELEQLVFSSTPGQVPPGQKVTTTFDLAVSDGTDVTTNTSTSVVATSSGPTLTGYWNLGAPDNGQPTAMLKALTVTDPESNGPETATITVLDANGNPTDANGVLSGAGLTETATGTYSISAASPAAMTAALHGLNFAFKNREVAPGQSVTTQFAVSVSDGTQTASAIVSKVTVVAQGVSIAAGSTFTLAAGASVNNTIYFAGSNATLSVGGTTLPTAVVTGFDLNGSIGDEIVLTGFSYVAGKDTVSLGANNVLSLNLNGTHKQLSLDPTANYTGHIFSIQTNSLDQVVVVDPAIGPKAQMGFLAPLFNGSEMRTADASLIKKADLFADLPSPWSRHPVASAIAGADQQIPYRSTTLASGAATTLFELIAHKPARNSPILLHLPNQLF